MNFDRLNRNTEEMILDQPHFRERIELARRSLNGVHATDGGLHFPGGIVAGPGGCTCQESINCVCVHLMAWRIFTTKPEERVA